MQLRNLTKFYALNYYGSILKFTKKRDFHVHDVKETFEEFIVTLSRVVYEETKDSQMFLDMRYRYKDKISNCTDYTVLQETITEFSKESINILMLCY